MLIMSAMHVSFSVLEAWHACTANSMTLTGSGSTQVGGGSSFLGLKLAFKRKDELAIWL